MVILKILIASLLAADRVWLALGASIHAPDGSDPGYDLCEARIPNANAYESLPNGVLRVVQVITRHGDRTPTEHLPNDDGVWDCSGTEERVHIIHRSKPTWEFRQVIETGAERGAKGWTGSGMPSTNCLLGQLTAKGISQLSLLGTALRELYVDMLGFLPDSLGQGDTPVYARATDSWRTKQSAMALLSGLYPVDTVPKDFVHDLIVYPLEADTLKARSALAYCPRFRQLRQAMYQSPIYKEAIERIAPDLQRTVEELLGTKSKNDFNAKVVGWDALSGYVPPRVCNDKPLPCNANGQCLTQAQAIAAVAARQFDVGESFNVLIHFYLLIVSWQYSWMYRDFSLEYSHLYVGPLMGELADRARSFGPKFQVYSAHDSTVAAILGFLGARDVLWPPLRANLVLEYWSTPAGEVVRLMYNGRLAGQAGGVQVPWCNMEDCPADRWFAYIDERTPQDLAAACVALSRDADEAAPADPHGGDL
ncbi:hypothetical protein HKX48_007791 [Thoreauomyces humboldtii]|nr:hypothetical protein HKX48_007791 [Thoreauomyces humboldtii]